MNVLALWEAKFNTPTDRRGKPLPAAPQPGTDSARWGNPHERERWQTGTATAKYIAEEHVDGVLVQREMRSTPEGIAWFMSGL